MIGRNIIRLDSVDSTNVFVQNEINNGRKFLDGEVVITLEQKRGKGLEKNAWESEAGQNITMTIFLQPTFLLAEKQFDLNKTVSLGILDFVKSKLPEETVSIKWPNDIYIGDGKVGGILINNTICGREFVHSIVGIGLNINQQRFLSNAPNPVSVRQFSQKKLDIEECLEEILVSIDKRYKLLESGILNSVEHDYLSVLYRINKCHEFIYSGEKIQATITGVSEFGQLQLQTKSLQNLECDLKEIEFVI